MKYYVAAQGECSLQTKVRQRPPDIKKGMGQILTALRRNHPLPITTGCSSTGSLGSRAYSRVRGWGADSFGANRQTQTKTSGTHSTSTQMAGPTELTGTTVGGGAEIGTPTCRWTMKWGSVLRKQSWSPHDPAIAPPGTHQGDRDRSTQKPTHAQQPNITTCPSTPGSITQTRKGKP